MTHISLSTRLSTNRLNLILNFIILCLFIISHVDFIIGMYIYIFFNDFDHDDDIPVLLMLIVIVNYYPNN